jgi:putative peptidoglycan lipid II flippase
VTAATPSHRGLARDTATVTALNLASRLSGFARVLAVGAALGATSLGDTYQAANLVSNILFELLAGGILAAVLVPTFVGLLDRGRREEAGQLAGALVLRVLGALAVLVALGMVLAPWIMRLLTATVADPGLRELQADLGTFLLWFFLPQVLLYAVGAVATALLQADRRFVAAAVAPICNNAVVIATMVAFRARAGSRPGLPLDLADRVLLAGGTTLGVVVMTLAPLVAARRAGLLRSLRVTAPEGIRLRELAGKGVWAAGHLGANQVLVGVTVIVAAAVAGGVIAYQIAFTFFLLPHAVLAHPVATTLYPRLATDAVAGRTADVARGLARGLRLCTFLLAPAAVALAALATPVLQAARLGDLDAAGADLVAATLAAYSVGLLGYSATFLLTRASYAVDDARTPSLVLGGATALAVVAMLAGATLVEGTGRLVALGLIHGAAQTCAAIVLLARVRARLAAPVVVAASGVRAVLVALVAGAAGWWVANRVGVATRPDAMLATVVGGAVIAAAYLAGQRLLGASEVAELRGLVAR